VREAVRDVIVLQNRSGLLNAQENQGRLGILLTNLPEVTFATMTGPFLLILSAAISLAAQGQASGSAAPNQVAQVSTTKEEVVQVLTVLRRYGASPLGWIGETGSPTRSEIERVLADEHLSINEAGQTTTKADILQKCCRPEKARVVKNFALETQLSSRIEDLDVKVYGATAVANYKNQARIVFNEEAVVKTFNSTEVLVKRAGRWQSLMHTETVIPGEPEWTFKINPKVYDEYVGKYRLTANYLYTVTRAGDKLFWESDQTELIPESDTTFLKKGAAPPDGLYRTIFVRNDEGRVTHVRIREYPGVEYSAIKIE
jgi:hypothetical protein